MRSALAALALILVTLAIPLTPATDHAGRTEAYTYIGLAPDGFFAATVTGEPCRLASVSTPGGVCIVLRDEDVWNDVRLTLVDESGAPARGTATFLTPEGRKTSWPVCGSETLLVWPWDVVLRVDIHAADATCPAAADLPTGGTITAEWIWR